MDKDEGGGWGGVVRRMRRGWWERKRGYRAVVDAGEGAVGGGGRLRGQAHGEAHGEAHGGAHGEAPSCIVWHTISPTVFEVWGKGGS